MKRKRILIAPNSFKKCADAVTIAELIKYYLNGLENSELIIKPISDGGDGFLTVCKYYFGGEIKKYLISTPYDDSKFECPILVNSDQKSIYVESAEVLGFKRVPVSKRNPLLLSSHGLGELLLKINEDIVQGILEAEKVYIGIGGTATIDMGLGMMSQLGLELYDSEGVELVVLPKYFRETAEVKYRPISLSFSLHLVIDVLNKLFGKDSGIRVFGRQKGANEISIKLLEKNFGHIYNLINNNNLLISSEELSGAGGGLSAVLQIFLNSQLIHSENFIFGHLKLGSSLSDIDYLITGEGSFDRQSIFGKGAGVLVKKFSKQVKLIFLICGEMEEYVVNQFPKNFHIIQLVDFFDSKSESIKRFNEGIKMACYKIIEKMNF